MTEKMIEAKQFTCPQCGSNQFGTYYPGHGTQGGIGTCHGYIGVSGASNEVEPCGFTWPRSEDAKYFKGTGVFHPAEQVAVVVEKPPK